MGRLSGTARLYAIKARLYDSGEEEEEEEIRIARRIAQGMRRCAEFAVLQGAAL